MTQSGIEPRSPGPFLMKNNETLEKKKKIWIHGKIKEINQKERERERKKEEENERQEE